MKKLYLTLLTALLATVYGFGAQAQQSLTIKWDVPGAIKIRLNSIVDPLIEIPADATELQVQATGAVYIAGDNGYMVVSGTAEDGYVQKPFLSNGEFLLNINTNQERFKNKSVTVTTKKVVNDRKFTLKVVNGAAKIKEFSVGNLKLTSFENGEHEYSFCSDYGTSGLLSFAVGITPLSVKFNGAAVNPFYGQYKNMTFNGDDVLEVQVYEDGQEPATEKCTVTLDLKGKAQEAIKNIFNNTTLKAVEPVDGKFEVEKGNKLTFNFNEDYDITTFKAGDNDITLFDRRGSLTVNESLTITIDATVTTYTTETFTAYLVCPEGLELWAGNPINGEQLTLGEGVTVTEEISLPGTLEQEAYTIPAGGAVKYTLPVSTKYGTVNVMVKDGYWIRQTREADKVTQALNPISSKTFYIIAEPVENDSKATIYFHGEANSIKLSPSILHGAMEARTISEEGYSTLNFDKDYESPFSIKMTSAINSLKVFFNGTELTADDDGNLPELPLSDGSLVEIIANAAIPASHTLTFSKEDETAASMKYDSAEMTIDFDKAMKCYDETLVTITPEPGTEVRLDGEALTPDYFGNCTFTVTADHAIALVKKTIDTSWTPFPEKYMMGGEYVMVALSFAEGTMVEVANETLISVKLNGDAMPAASYMVMAEGNMFGIQFPMLAQAGELELSLAAGALKISGTASPAIEYTWNILLPKEYTVQITPAPGTDDAPAKVSSLAELTLVFPEAETARPVNEYGVFLKNNKYDDTRYYETGIVTAVEGAEHPTFKVTFAKPAVTPGKYTFSIRYGAFFLDELQDFMGTDAYYEFDPSSGIDAITAESGEKTVYNLQGILIEAEWDSLPAGVYIVNGKKVKK